MTLNPLKGKSPKVRAKLKLGSKKKTKLSSSQKSNSSKNFVPSRSPLSSGSFCREIQKSVDEVLLKLSPNLQAQIDQMVKTLDKSNFNLQDLRTLGYRILKQASEVSAAIQVAPLFTTSVHSFITKQKAHSLKPSLKKHKKVLL